MKRNQIAWWLWAVGTVLIVLSWIDVISTTIRAATNDLAPFRTNFIAGASLSSSELDSVIKLANLCEVRSVADVSTIRHLSGTTVEVNGDERFEGRSVIFKKLQIHRRGWDRRVRPNNTPSIGDFWVESAKPQREERTIVQIGDRKLRVGLLNGIKPAGADKIIEALMKGRVRFGADSLKAALSGVDVTQASWIGISQGKLWITFSSPYTRFIFAQDGDQITLVDKVQMYE